jgi:hypothetical protein
MRRMSVSRGRAKTADIKQDFTLATQNCLATILTSVSFLYLRPAKETKQKPIMPPDEKPQRCGCQNDQSKTRRISRCLESILFYLSRDSASPQVLITWLWCDVAEERDSKFKYTVLSFIDSETSRSHVKELTHLQIPYITWHSRAWGHLSSNRNVSITNLSTAIRKTTRTKADLSPSPTNPPLPHPSLNVILPTYCLPTEIRA